MSEKNDLKGSDPSLEEGDWIVRQLFSPEELRMSPEEYAARQAHLWGCFSLHRYRYSDPALAHWINRLADILASGEEIERCRRHFLTAEELASVQQRKIEEF